MINNLLKIYPDSLLNPDDKVVDNLNNYYLVEEDSNQLYIFLEKLNQKEFSLLKLIVNKKNIEKKMSNPFRDLLFNGASDELITIEKIQMVYLQINHLEKDSFQVWKDTLMDSLVEVMDVLLITKSFVVLILNAEEVKKETINKIREVIQSLDQDFSVLTQGLIGQVSNLNRQTKNIFTYERNIFQSFIKRHKVDGIITFSEMLIPNMAVSFKKTAPLLPKLSNYLSENNEIKQLIEQ